MDTTTPDGVRSWRIRASGDLMRLQEAERRKTPFLFTRDGGDAQHFVALPAAGTALTMGRDPGCDIALEWDPSISRVHAELRPVGGQWTLEDDGLSRNGTFVNGHRLSSRVRLKDGDVIRLGDTQVEFRSPGPDPAELTVATGGGNVVQITAGQRRVLLALARPFAAGRAHAVPATNADIAAELFLTVDAVKATLRTLFGKFALGDMPQNQKRAKLVELALDLGVISEPELSR